MIQCSPFAEIDSMEYDNFYEDFPPLSPFDSMWFEPDVVKREKAIKLEPMSDDYKIPGRDSCSFAAAEKLTECKVLVRDAMWFDTESTELSKSVESTYISVNENGWHVNCEGEHQLYGSVIATDVTDNFSITSNMVLDDLPAVVIKTEPVDDDEDEEIDVVSLDSDTEQKKQDVLPRAQSIVTHIAEMHNYSLSYSALRMAPHLQKKHGTQKRAALATFNASQKKYCKVAKHRTDGNRFGREQKHASRSPSDLENDEERRELHNVLERERRNMLKVNFQMLKNVIPELKSNGRISKLGILKTSRDYIRHVSAVNEKLTKLIDSEKALNAELREKLKQLKHNHCRN